MIEYIPFKNYGYYIKIFIDDYPYIADLLEQNGYKIDKVEQDKVYNIILSLSYTTSNIRLLLEQVNNVSELINDISPDNDIIIGIGLHAESREAVSLVVMDDIAERNRLES